MAELGRHLRERRLDTSIRVLWLLACCGTLTALPTQFQDSPTRGPATAALAGVAGLWGAYSVVWGLLLRGRREAARSVLFGSWIAYVSWHLGSYRPGLGSAHFEILFVAVANAVVAMMEMALLALAEPRTAGRWLAALLAAYSIGAVSVGPRFEDVESLQTWMATTGLSMLLLGSAAWFASRFAGDHAEALARGQRLRREVEHALAEAREANLAKSQFLANMSHELRTPLTGIVGYTELLQEATDLTPFSIAKDLDHIRAAALHLNGIIGDVLDLSKIEAGKLQLEVVDVDPASLVGEVVATSRPMADRRSNSLTVTTNRLPASLRTDPGRLRQVLLNLLSNASKFTDHGTITLFVEGVGDRVRFVVSDTGIGIPSDKLEAIFQPFEQVDASTTRKYGGTGLGLTVCRQLLRVLGGELIVRSRLGEGATFEFSVGSLAADHSSTGVIQTMDAVRPSVASARS